MTGDAIRVLLVGTGEGFGTELESEDFEVARIPDLASLGPGTDQDAVIVALDDPGPLEALETLRLKTPAAAVLVLTAAGHEADGAVALHAGGEDHLVRDQIAEGLLPRAVRYAVERRRLRRDSRRSTSSLGSPTSEDSSRSRSISSGWPIARERPSSCSSCGWTITVPRWPAPTCRRRRARHRCRRGAAERDPRRGPPRAHRPRHLLRAPVGRREGRRVSVLSRLVEAIAVHDSNAPDPKRLPSRSAARSTTRSIRRPRGPPGGRRSRPATPLIRDLMTCEYLPRRSDPPGRRYHERIDDDRHDAERSVRSAEPADARDEVLLQRVVAGDEQAFRELFGRYAAVAHALAFRLVRQAQVAEEIVQEAFLAVWRNPDRYDAAEGVGPLLAHGHRPPPGGRRRETGASPTPPRRTGGGAGAEDRGGPDR